MRSNIDTLRTDFENSSGETSSIWLWKGNYNMVFNGGWHIGAEIGAYGNYGEADDSMFKSVSFELIDKNTGKFVSRSVDGKYWTNRFDKGKCNPEGRYSQDYLDSLNLDKIPEVQGTKEECLIM